MTSTVDLGDPDTLERNAIARRDANAADTRELLEKQLQVSKRTIDVLQFQQATVSRHGNLLRKLRNRLGEQMEANERTLTVQLLEQSIDLGNILTTHGETIRKQMHVNEGTANNIEALGKQLAEIDAATLSALSAMRARRATSGETAHMN